MRFNDHIHNNAYPASYYTATCNDLDGFSRLSGDERVDVCIIGGGFSGIATALHLSERGFKVAVVEQNLVGWGASGRNGGQIIGGYGHALSDHKKMVKTFGQAGGDSVWDMGVECVDIITQWVEKYNIECDLRFGYFDAAIKQSDMVNLTKAAEALAAKNYPHECKIVPASEVQDYVASARYVGGLTNEGWGQVHVLNLLLGEARAAENLGARIYENAEVIDIVHGDKSPDGKSKVVTDCGTITSDYVVVTGNGYLRDLVPHLASRVLPAGSYIIATEPLTEAQVAATLPQDYAVCDQRWALDYFRLSKDNRLLFGGLANYSGRHPRNISSTLVPKMLRVFPHLKDIKIDFEWGGFMGIGLNRIPQVGRLSDTVYFATAYGGHGVAPTHMSAKLIAEAIAGQAERYDILAAIKHPAFPGGKHLMQPAYTIGMLYYKMRDIIGW
ncbi:MAG: FAD-dependent oxidoreductase [Alphaproteobacteria bacterium]|nr:MAG: FAD-dependent oxidoreductase [Alphaproteobacteria bacterium]